MFGRHPGRAHPQPPGPGRVDEPASAVAVGVGEDRPRVLSPGLVGPPPGHYLRQQGPPGGGVTGGQLQPGLRHHLVRGDSAGPIAEPEIGGRRGEGGAQAEVDDLGLVQHRGRVGAVAARVHAHRPAHRPGHPHRPLEPGQPLGHGPAGQLGQRGPSPGPHRRPGHAETGQVALEGQGQAAEPGVGHQQVGAPAQHQHRRLQAGGAGGDQVERGPVAHRDEEAGRAADPVGGAGAQRVAAAHRGRQRRPGQALLEVGHRGRCLVVRRLGRPRVWGDGGHGGAPPSPAWSRSMTASGTPVRSPAPRVRQRSPGRSRR